MEARGPQLTVVIVNWNTRDLTVACVRSVLDTVRRHSFQVIVVDNASTDGSAEHLRATFPEIRVIESGGNLGFARGNNVALRQVHSEYVLLLNPDTVACENALDRLCDALAAYPKLGAVGPQLLNPDGSLQHSWAPFPYVEREIPLVRRLAEKPPVPLTVAYAGQEISLLLVDWAKGACLMMRGETLAQVGLLDEDYWLYTEETDWCHRARQHGWEIAARPDAHVMHIEAAASAQRLGPSFVNFADSRMLFVKKHQSRAAAAGVWAVFAARSAAWALMPRRSHLGKHHGAYTEAEVRNAYLTFLRTWRDRALGRSE
jgi:hypothetical protein